MVVETDLAPSPPLRPLGGRGRGRRTKHAGRGGGVPPKCGIPWLARKPEGTPETLPFGADSPHLSLILSAPGGREEITIAPSFELRVEEEVNRRNDCDV